MGDDGMELDRSSVRGDLAMLLAGALVFVALLVLVGCGMTSAEMRDAAKEACKGIPLGRVTGGGAYETWFAFCRDGKPSYVRVWGAE